MARQAPGSSVRISRVCCLVNVQFDGPPFGLRMDGKMDQVQSLKTTRCEPANAGFGRPLAGTGDAGASNIIGGAGHIGEHKCLYKPHTSGRRGREGIAISRRLQLSESANGRPAWRRAGVKPYGWRASQ